MKKIIRLLLMLGLFFAMFTVCRQPVNAETAEEGNIYSSWGYLAGSYNAKGQIVFNPCTEEYKGHSPGQVNSNALQALCSLDGEKTIIIPSGSSVELLNVVHLTSNTTIIATSADIYTTQKGKGLINNYPTAVDYKSIENITIDGGTWRTTDKENACSIFRFCHGNNVVVKNARIIGNYQSHDIELIAMKNTTVKNCTLTVQGTKDKNSVEESLQIDVASPSTAPGLLTTGTFNGVSYGGTKYVKGQTCQNIKILNNYIKGSRGLCANYSENDGKKIKKKFHDNIIIKNNTLIGVSAEGCTLYNTLNATVTGNTIKTTSTRKTTSYSVGLNITIQGKASASVMKKTNLVIKNNTVKGYRQGIQILSRSSSDYQKATVKNNTCYATKKADALKISDVKSRKVSGNKLKKRK